ncbi:hypothetical protein C0J52_13028 [Blattella germanica]|nr:hypothetical protein C0J52_13028 [Blattella germanica]
MSGPKGRKGTTSSDQYQRNSIPDLKVNGLEYVNSIQEICSPRKTGDDCRCKNKNCFSLVDGEKQMSIISHLNKLKNKDKQDIYLQGLIEVEQVKSRRPRKEIPKVRSNNYSYFIMVENKKINVCKRAFISLHGITEKRVRRLCLTLVKGESPCDLRQKHIKINKLFHEVFSKKLY